MQFERLRAILPRMRGRQDAELCGVPEGSGGHMAIVQWTFEHVARTCCRCLGKPLIQAARATGTFLKPRQVRRASVVLPRRREQQVPARCRLERLADWPPTVAVCRTDARCAGNVGVMLARSISEERVQQWC